ncbi:hypothetical protein A2U01_0030001 [Trifolium medium]|uniref:Uncharacterized protein n=1 Tax=Trifolium medium TaxID=97028 RepID=A0A392PBQ6_9FABA|nr:hypothetical protein [Trifolium medium]
MRRLTKWQGAEYKAHFSRTSNGWFDEKDVLFHDKDILLFGEAANIFNCVGELRMLGGRRSSLGSSDQSSIDCMERRCCVAVL